MKELKALLQVAFYCYAFGLFVTGMWEDDFMVAIHYYTLGFILMIVVRD